VALTARHIALVAMLHNSVKGNLSEPRACFLSRCSSLSLSVVLVCMSILLLLLLSVIVMITFKRLADNCRMHACVNGFVYELKTAHH